MAWRTAGKVGWGGGPLILFFPPCCFKPAILEESVGDHRHERMTIEALPGSALEVIEAKFILQLLMGLLAEPARLDARAGRTARSRLLLRSEPAWADRLQSRRPAPSSPLRLSAHAVLTQGGNHERR